MVIIATQVGFSPALGAFVMGSILAETAQGEKIEHLLEPVKNLFSAVFFVSVGMLIQPQILREHLGVVLLISAVTIFGKLLSSAFGALLAGRSFKTSLQAGLSLAQIGEFSFIIATLGLTLKVTSDFLYPIAVAVSALTTFTTPYLIRSAEALAIRLERRLPPGVREALDRYQSNLSTTSNRTVFAGIWHAYGPKTALNSVMVIAIGLAATYLLPESTEMGRLVACLLTLILASPFLWAIFFGTSTKTTPYILGVTLVRALIGLSLTLFVLSPFLSTVTFSGLVLVVLGAFAIFWFTPFSRWVYARLETRFLSNLQAEPAHPKLAPWNAGLAAYTLTSASPLAALTLQNSGLKERYGVTVAMLERAGARFVAPDRDMILWPGDNLFLLGSDEQLAAVQPRIEAPVPVDAENDDIGLVSLRLDATHPLTGKSIRDCGLRESALGLIVGVERGGERHLNPDPSMQLSAGDLIWVVGQRRPLRRLRSTTTT
jgi:CPA2 family monovalent cation:H+ antiporter-2